MTPARGGCREGTGRIPAQQPPRRGGIGAKRAPVVVRRRTVGGRVQRQERRHRRRCVLRYLPPKISPEATLPKSPRAGQLQLLRLLLLQLPSRRRRGPTPPPRWGHRPRRTPPQRKQTRAWMQQQILMLLLHWKTTVLTLKTQKVPKSMERIQSLPLPLMTAVPAPASSARKRQFHLRKQLGLLEGASLRLPGRLRPRPCLRLLLVLVGRDRQCRVAVQSGAAGRQLRAMEMPPTPGTVSPPVPVPNALPSSQDTTWTAPRRAHCSICPTRRRPRMTATGTRMEASGSRTGRPSDGGG